MIWSYQLNAGGYLTIRNEGNKSGFMLDVSYSELEDRFPSNINLNDFLTQDRQRLVVKHGLPVPIPYFPRKEERIRSEKRPRQGDVKELRHLISRSQEDLVFYTGAGLSRASGIWGTKELVTQLFINDLPVLTRTCIEDPNVIITRFKMFLWRIKLAKPTTAHLALARLIKHYGLGMIITENIDTLHQESGVQAHLALGNKKLYSIRPKHVITLGISCPTEVDLLQFWKWNGATIHCVTKEAPECLHLADYLYLQDVQQLLPKWGRDLEVNEI